MSNEEKKTFGLHSEVCKYKWPCLSGLSQNNFSRLLDLPKLFLGVILCYPDLLPCGYMVTRGDSRIVVKINNTKLVARMGLEPMTGGLWVLCSTCLSYLALTGGRGETRTHTSISEPSVFKTAAARPTRLTLPNMAGLDGIEPSTGWLTVTCSTYWATNQLVHDKRIELFFTGWKPVVLTTRRIVRGNGIYHNFICPSTAIELHCSKHVQHLPSNHLHGRVGDGLGSWRSVLETTSYWWGSFLWFVVVPH